MHGVNMEAHRGELSEIDKLRCGLQSPPAAAKLAEGMSSRRTDGSLSEGNTPPPNNGERAPGALTGNAEVDDEIRAFYQAREQLLAQRARAS
jgi:hypothetical protein